MIMNAGQFAVSGVGQSGLSVWCGCSQVSPLTTKLGGRAGLGRPEAGLGQPGGLRRPARGRPMGGLGGPGGPGRRVGRPREC